MLLNSGFAVYPPSLIFPYLEKPRYIKNINDVFIVTTYNQLKFVLIYVFILLNTSADNTGFEIVKMIKARTNTAVTTDTNIFISKPNLVKFLERNFYLLFLNPYNLLDKSKLF